MPSTPSHFQTFLVISFSHLNPVRVSPDPPLVDNWRGRTRLENGQCDFLQAPQPPESSGPDPRTGEGEKATVSPAPDLQGAPPHSMSAHLQLLCPRGSEFAARGLCTHTLQHRLDPGRREGEGLVAQVESGP